MKGPKGVNGQGSGRVVVGCFWPDGYDCGQYGNSCSQVKGDKKECESGLMLAG